MNKKHVLLLKGILLDFIGILSYSIPILGEYSDAIWAPIAAFILYRMYPGTQGKIGSIVVLLEEVLPFIDFIPTFTITWFYTFYLDKNQNEVIKKTIDKP